MDLIKKNLNMYAAVVGEAGERSGRKLNVVALTSVLTTTAMTKDPFYLR